MEVHNLVQGTPEWHAYRTEHDNASDAPAVMGVSSYKKREHLIAERATGVAPEIDAATQRLFDSGHRFEALARPRAEEIIGDDLYPVTGSRGRLSASFDGLTMAKDTAYEHKRLNQRLRAAFAQIEALPAGEREARAGLLLPDEYQVQMEQQCDVSGCTKVLFMATSWSDDGALLEMQYCWYYPNLDLRARIVAGWEQFHKDVAAYQPTAAAAPPVVGRRPENLPALLIQVSGAITATTLPEFKEHALAVLGGVNRTLSTDQDFATAESTVKWCADVEGQLAAAKAHALSQTASIEEVFRTIDEISAETRRVRLDLNKLVTARKEEIRGEIVAGGVSAFRDHIASLNARLGKPYMPAVPVDFNAAVKGKRTLDSLRGAVNDELARAKIAANEIADRIQLNLNTLREQATAHAFLFADAPTLVMKANDDLQVLIKSRIGEHEAKEAKRLEDERARIRAEEQERADREAREKLLQQERDAQAAIAQAKAAEQLAAPLAEDLSNLAREKSQEAVAGIDAGQAISQAQRAAAAGPAVVPIRPAAAPATEPTLKLGVIGARLGFTLSADFLRSLGFEPAGKQGAHGVYHEAQFPQMLAALVRHIESVQAKAAA